MSAPESIRRPSRACELRERFAGCDGDLGLLARLAGLIRGERVGGDGDGRTVGARCQAVVRQDDVGRQELGEAGDRHGLGPADLAHRPHADDRRRRVSRARPREGRGRPREADRRDVEGGAGAAVGPTARWHRRRATPTMSAVPHPTRRRRRRSAAQPGDDLELLLARGRELPADFGEAFLVFPGQRTSAGVGRTFAPRAAGAVHDRNAKAARPRVVGASHSLRRVVASLGDRLQLATEGIQGGFTLAPDF